MVRLGYLAFVAAKLLAGAVCAQEYRVHIATFPSAHHSLSPANDTVWVELRTPPGPGPFPCIVVLPILGAESRFIPERFMRALVRRGYAAAFVELPHQFHRRPSALAPSGQGFLSRTPEGLAKNMAQAVSDVRDALTWLQLRPEIDPGHLGILGVSLGAFVGAATASMDARVSAAVFLLGGAGLPQLLRESSLTGPTLRQLGYSAQELEDALKAYDAWTYRGSNSGKRFLLMNARWDSVIPRASALNLAQAFPDAKHEWVWGGHYSSVLHLIWLPRRAVRYFDEQWGGSYGSSRPRGFR